MRVLIAPVEAPSAGNLPQAIAYLLHADPPRADDTTYNFLDRLSRKICVSRQLVVQYQEDWKRTAGNEPLPADATGAAIALLAQYGGEARWSSLSQSCRYLNAGLVLNDRLEDRELRVSLERILVAALDGRVSS